MSFIFGKKEDPNNIQTIITSIQDSPTTELYTSLLNFIPNESELILTQLLNNMVLTLIRPSSDPLVQKSIIDVMHKIIFEAESKNPDSHIYLILIEHVNLVQSLMEHIYPLNEKIIYIIDKLYLKYPNIFIEYIIEHLNSAEEMIKLIGATKNQQASMIFQKISVSRKDVFEKLKPLIAKNIRAFPASTFVDYMIASPDLRGLIPNDEIEEWLLQNNRFTIFDVESLLEFYPLLWETETFLIILSMTEPDPGTKHINWIHDKSPQEKEIKLETKNAVATASSLIDPKTGFNVTEDIRRNKIQPDEPPPTPILFYDQCESYAFVRLYCLSFANPSDLDPNTIIIICGLCKDKHEYIAAAAMQTLIFWIINYKLTVETYLVYRTAGAIFEEERPDNLKLLYKAFLRVLGTIFDNAVSILVAEPSLTYRESMGAEIQQSKWCFPHFNKMLDIIPRLKLVDYSDSFKALGYILQYLGVGEKL